VTGIRGLHHRWILSRRAIPDRLWRGVLETCSHAQQLERTDRTHLRELCTLFLHRKTFSGAHDLEVTDPMRVHVALHACVPILNLGLDYYSRWKGVILYPGDFRVRQRFEDDSGVVHEGFENLCGESLSHGPMVLSWDAIQSEPDFPGQDLVIHECAHKLDILNGDADGFPPLHPEMNVQTWTNTMHAAYDTITSAADRGVETRLDPYAAADAAEFFAVVSETFFAAPNIVAEDFPDVYTQLGAFYRQNPINLLSPAP
jgi:MtfA peptidase